MPRMEIDFTTFTLTQVEALAASPGPTGRQARQFLDRGGKPLPVGSSTPGAGDIALSLLTPDQRAALDAQVAAHAAKSKVDAATSVLTTATATVVEAAQSAQAVIEAAPDVDTSALAAAVAVVQPVVDAQVAAAPVSTAPSS